ncbi:MAG: serine/threonine-protein kinase [Verrucomicrobiota bacterium]
MTDYFKLEPGKGIQSSSGVWYRCVQTLGAGGNAVAFLVLCTSGTHTGALFALKVFRRLSAPDRREKFLQETRLLFKLNHPCILRVFDEGVFHTSTVEYPFVVAEYLPNTLQQLLQRDIPFIEKLAFSMQLLSALNHLAEQNPQILHRDIKPANIFIKGRSCVLGDFGLMKFLDGNSATDRDVFKESIGPGMPFYYRTPDLVSYARNEADVTIKSDVFQLGLVLAQLFTGWNPCNKAEDPLSPVELTRLDEIPGKLGASIGSALTRMLAMKPEVRPSAAELFGHWQANFFDAVLHQNELEGRAF